MPEPLITTAMIAVSIQQGFQNLLNRLGVSVITAMETPLKAAFSNLTTGMNKHLDSNYLRCCNVKTLLNRSTPIDLLSLYVNTRFIVNKKTIEDYDLIDELYDKRRVIITGTGGGGKTMFMKYLWLALFTNPRGRIPIFIEMRRMNELSHDSLLVFAFNSIIDARAQISEANFNKAVNSGHFVFILDGFDEISADRKISLERQILKLSYDNPEAVVVVSSRPDKRFGAWQGYHEYRISPMSKDQILRVIYNLTYDRVIKDKFIAKVRDDLFDQHNSFLSNPLLATIMLMTFDQFAEIPSKMFLFYDHAFYTLFQFHDATKEGYTRNRKVDLSINVFKKILSFFCLITYFAEKFEFQEFDISSNMQKAVVASQANVNVSDFIDDLKEAVCILQSEGMVTTFTHRSFQEYFCAFCLANFVKKEQFSKIIPRIMKTVDNVVPMIFEMSQEKLEGFYVIPKLNGLLEAADATSATSSLVETAKLLDFTIAFVQIRSAGSGMVYFHESADMVFISIMERLYLHKFPKSARGIERSFSKCHVFVSEWVSKTRPRKKIAKNNSSIGIDIVFSPYDKDGYIRMSELSGSAIETYWCERWQLLRSIRDDATFRSKTSDENIEEILGIE